MRLIIFMIVQVHWVFNNNNQFLFPDFFHQDDRSEKDPRPQVFIYLIIIKCRNINLFRAIIVSVEMIEILYQR